MAMSNAQKQKAYRDRKRAIRDAPKLEAARRAAELERQRREAQDSLQRATQELARLAREAEELAARTAQEARQKAEEEAKARGIADGTLHPSGRPWRNGDVRGYDASSPRAMMEAGRKAALAYAARAGFGRGFSRVARRRSGHFASPWSPCDRRDRPPPSEFG
jgi:hypothetical protein